MKVEEYDWTGCQSVLLLTDQITQETWKIAFAIRDRGVSLDNIQLTVRKKKVAEAIKGNHFQKIFQVTGHQLTPLFPFSP